MPFSNPASNIITMTGTETLNNASVSGNTGITSTQYGDLTIIDLGQNTLQINGTLSINPDDSQEVVVLVGGVTDKSRSAVQVGNGGRLIVGNLFEQGLNQIATGNRFGDIMERQSGDFSDANAKAFDGESTLGNANRKPFFQVVGGGAFEHYGVINFTSGIGFDGTANKTSTPNPTLDAEIIIKGGVFDCRRVTERGGVGDQFLYNYSNNVTCDGITIISNEAVGIGFGIINLEQVNFKNYVPINTELAFTGSTSSRNDLEVVIEDYGGVIGNPDATDMTSATNNATNTCVVEFLNCFKEGDLKINTQNPGVSRLIRVQEVSGIGKDSLNNLLNTAVVGTQDINQLIYQSQVVNGAFNLGKVLLDEWNPDPNDNAADPIPVRFSPSGTFDHLFDFYLYSYYTTNRSRLAVLLRDKGGKVLEFITAENLNIDGVSHTQTALYTSLEDNDKLYRYALLYKVNNIGYPSIDKVIVKESGDILDLGDLNLTIKDNGSVFTALGQQLTINVNTTPVVQLLSSDSNGLSSIATSIIVNTPSGVENGDILILAVAAAQGDETTYNTPTNWNVLSINNLVGGSPLSKPKLNLYWKVANNEGSTQTITSNFSTGHVAQIFRIKNAASSPLDATPVITSSSTGDPDSTAITPTEDGTLAILVGVLDSGNQDPVDAPSGYTKVLQSETLVGGTEGSGGGGSPTVLGPFNFDTQAANQNDFIFNGPAGAGLATANGQWYWRNNATGSTNVGPDNGQGGSGDGYIYTEMTSQADGDLWELELNQNLNADANTAVTALLSQFTFSANGDIRESAVTDTFHVWWLHRALQKIAWDFAISGDDEINLSKPNPSTSEAIGTIITLLDHTTDYGVNYNITAAEAENFFGGSISQDNGDNEWGGLIVLGSVNSPTTELQIIQNNALLTSHWGTGKNQTDGNTLLRILVQTKNAGSVIDGGRIIVKANEWGDTFAVWRTTLGVGEKVASIQTFADPQNDTDLATVQAYVGITNTEGYQLLDIADGSGGKEYYAQWNRGSNSKKQLYEYIKSLMVRGSAESIYGLDGNLFTGGPTFEAEVDGGSGTFVQNEIVSWTENGTPSTGILMYADDLDGTNTSKVGIHLLTGINPSDNTVLSGAGGGAANVNVTVTSLTSSANHVGQYTGSWIASKGVGFAVAELNSTDSVIPLDASSPISPPNNVTISVAVNGATDPHVFLARKGGGNGYDLNEYTLAAGNNSGNGTLVINEAIKSDTPPSGFVLVQEGTTFEPIEYSAFSGSTFTLVGTLSKNYTAGRNTGVPIMYDSAVGGSDPRVLTTSLIYNADIPVVGWVRHGDPAAPNKPVNISGTIGTAGLSLTVQLDTE